MAVERREAALLAFLREPRTVEEIAEHGLVHLPTSKGRTCARWSGGRRRSTWTG
ncbi:hypothetical protein ACFV7R_45535 [Streptomyces sp. NPDC059866]|uniref:hypothetical protein n=1 Tax=Streptomyces sp. NPDC059866 TaxID=3346978 RepID=UPI00365D59BC